VTRGCGRLTAAIVKQRATTVVSPVTPRAVIGVYSDREPRDNPVRASPVAPAKWPTGLGVF